MGPCLLVVAGREWCGHLVVAALEEGGVDGADGDDAFTRQPRCERDGVLLRDAHIEAALGEPLRKLPRATCPRIETGMRGGASLPPVKVAERGRSVPC